MNLHLFQSYDPVSKIQYTTYRGCRSDLINSKNATEYVLLAIRPWKFVVHKVMPILDELHDLV